MLRQIIFLTIILTFASIAFAQSVIVKDSDTNTLLEIIDEGDYGALSISPWLSGNAPQEPLGYKLYNRNGDLFE